jgi:hypothetical protein
MILSFVNWNQWDLEEFFLQVLPFVCGNYYIIKILIFFVILNI